MTPNPVLRLKCHCPVVISCTGSISDGCAKQGTVSHTEMQSAVRILTIDFIVVIYAKRDNPISLS
jgi:hypothetical protein